MTEQEFHNFIITHLKTAMPHQADALDDVAADQDLIASGLVDSFAFIDLCLAIEGETGYFVDLVTLEPDQYSTISNLYMLSHQNMAA